MDRIFIEDLAVDALIGVYEWEREILQPLILTIEMATDIKPAAAADEISLTLDYFAISQAVTRHVHASSFRLIETLAESIAELIIQEFQVPWLRLKVSKPGAVGNARNVAVQIERSHRSALATRPETEAHQDNPICRGEA